jgi:hypothetical protein
MTGTRALLAPFDDDVVADVVEEHDCEEDALRRALRDHQELARSLPGVENLVYEWRKQYDTLVVRTDGAYYIVVPASVWAEYRPHLDATDDVFDAVEAVHERQLRRAVEVEGGDVARLDDGDAVVLARE